MTDVITDVLGDLLQHFANLFDRNSDQLLVALRQPTPLKLAKAVSADATGTIGGGFADPHAGIEVFALSEANEAWINRVFVMVPGKGPTTGNVTAGEIMLFTSNGQPILFAPDPNIGGGTTVAPVFFTEGRLSALHMSPGERIIMVGDGLPASQNLVVFVQLTLVAGISTDAPKNHPGSDRSGMSDPDLP